jgi:hypothetical protein
MPNDNGGQGVTLVVQSDTQRSALLDATAVAYISQDDDHTKWVRTEKEAADGLVRQLRTGSVDVEVAPAIAGGIYDYLADYVEEAIHDASPGCPCCTPDKRVGCASKRLAHIGRAQQLLSLLSALAACPIAGT